MESNRAHQMDEVIQYNLLKNSQRSIKQAQWMLFGVSILGILGTAYLYYFYYIPVFVLIVGAVFSFIYLLLGLLSFRKPKVPIIVGLVIYAVLVLGITRFFPSTILDGIIIKILVLAALVKGFIAARQAEVLQYKLMVIRTKLKEKLE